MTIPIEDVERVRSTTEHQTFDGWLENNRPTIAVDVISASTRVDDFVTKGSRYARLGVGEFYIFDPQGKFLETPVQGFRLQDRTFVALEPAKEKTLCLGPVQLLMRREGIFLRLLDPVTGEKVLSYEEMLAKVDAAQAEAEDARRLAEGEARRAATAEEENQRLREQLARFQGKDTV